MVSFFRRVDMSFYLLPDKDHLKKNKYIFNHVWPGLSFPWKRHCCDGLERSKRRSGVLDDPVSFMTVTVRWWLEKPVALFLLPEHHPKTGSPASLRIWFLREERPGGRKN